MNPEPAALNPKPSQGLLRSRPTLQRLHRRALRQQACGVRRV